MGIILFCGFIYGLVIAKSILNDQHWIKSIMGPLTPIGGTLLITGWIISIFHIKKVIPYLESFKIPQKWYCFALYQIFLHRI